MTAVEIRKASPNEAPQIAFDRVARKVRALFAAGYRVKQPQRRGLQPGEFAVEKLPLAGGWKLTVEPLNGSVPETELAA